MLRLQTKCRRINTMLYKKDKNTEKGINGSEIKIIFVIANQ